MKIYLAILFLLIGFHCQAGEIIDIDHGLTLARINHGKTVQILAVLEDNGTAITALNISELSGVNADIPYLYRKLEYEGIKNVILKNRTSRARQYLYSELLSPAGKGQHHVALGFNYADHAKEEGAEQEPFLFLKTTRPTRMEKISTGGQILLDYEIEVCARPLSDIHQSMPPGETPYGFFIGGDFTDRALLLRNINLDHMQSGEGFSRAKSKKGYFPTGPYMVIPKDRDWFLSKVILKLYRNGELKQNGTASDMIWKPDTIVSQIFLAEQAQKPTFSDVSAHWLPGDGITSDMVFLTGTPEGVIMHPPSLIHKIKSGIQFVFTGAFLKTTIVRYAIEKYIADLIGKKYFLQPGESVSMEGTYMGKTTLEICEE